MGTNENTPDNRSRVAASVFSGAGGLDIGMEQAGFVTHYAIDADADCIDTLKVNKHLGHSIPGNGRKYLSEATLVNRDLASLKGSTVRRQIGRRVDCLYGGPPCQSFSSCGKMGSISDPRGQLLFEYCRFISELRPRSFVLENVRGLVTARCHAGEPGGVLKELVRQCESIGYAVNVGLLNAADFGSPQRRVRCFVIGVDSGSPPDFPFSTHARTRKDGGLFADDQLPWVSLRDFLSTNTDDNIANWVRPTPTLAAQLATVPDGSGLKSNGVRETTRPGGHWGYRQGTFIADQSLPARTVTGSSSQDWVRLADGSLRRLTFQECARLQGFPDSWRFRGTKASRFKQVGNAVPVVLGRAVGDVIIKFLSNYRPGRLSQSKPLPAQLISAAEYTKREERRNGESRKSKGRLVGR